MMEFRGGLRYYWERANNAHAEAPNQTTICGTKGGLRFSFCTWESPEIEYLVGLVRRGYWISLDRLSSGALPEYGPQTVDDRLRMIVRLIDLGYGDSDYRPWSRMVDVYILTPPAGRQPYDPGYDGQYPRFGADF